MVNRREDLLLAVIDLVILLLGFLVIYGNIRRKRTAHTKLFFMIGVCIIAASILLFIHILILPFGVYVFISRIYEIMISNIGFTAVIAAAGLGLNAIKSDYNQRSRDLIFECCTIAIVTVVSLGICYFTGVADFTSFGENYIYRGQTFDNKAEGFGTVYDRVTEGVVYRGYFKNNQYDGQGVLYTERQYSDGTEKYELAYIGAFKNNQYNGKGILFSFTDDSNYICYTGEFWNGVFWGKGTFYFYDPSYYGDEVDISTVSEETRNQINTSHLFLRYDGYFANNMFNGDGTFYDKTNGEKYKVYSGAFKDNQFSGYGKLYFPGGYLKYEGEFKDGQYHGHGTEYVLPEKLLLPDDAQNTHRLQYDSVKWYSGEFEYGRYEGFGTIYDEDGGIIKTGIFSNGDLVSG